MPDKSEYWNVAGDIGAAAINAYSTGNQNRKSRRFSREMYALQKQDALEFWNMQNEYNSPQSQMKRFQDAGLNPHLIYGRGDSGSASAISTPDVQAPQFRTPEWGNAVAPLGLSLVSAFADLDIKQAQVDNLKAQNAVILQDALLRGAQIGSLEAGTAKTKFDLEFASEFRAYSAEALKEAVRQAKTNTDISLNRDAREAALNASTIKEAAERMLTMQQQRVNARTTNEHTKEQIRQTRENIYMLEREGILKEMDIALRQSGIQPNDPMWARFVARFLSNSGQSGRDFNIQSIIDYFKK